MSFQYSYSNYIHLQSFKNLIVHTIIYEEFIYSFKFIFFILIADSRQALPLIIVQYDYTFPQ